MSPLSLPADIAAAVRKLRLGARRATERAALASHRVPRGGGASYFREHRPFMACDDIRQLDWRVLAKTGRKQAKTYDDEARRAVLIACDASPSMRFGDAERHKLKFALTLALALADVALRADDPVALVDLNASHASADALPARTGRAQRAHAAAWLGRRLGEVPSQSENKSSVERELHRHLRHSQRVVLIGDWLSGWCGGHTGHSTAQPYDFAPLRALLLRLTAQRRVVSLVHVTHPNERDFPFASRATFRDCATTCSVTTDAARARDGYLASLMQFDEALQATCHAHRVARLTLSAGAPLMPVLAALARG